MSRPATSSSGDAPSSRTVEVRFFGEGSDKMAVTLPIVSTSSELKAAVGECLGLKPSSLQLFGLFVGPLGSPSRLLSDEDPVPQGGATLELCLQRWWFDRPREEKASRHDDVAVGLLCKEARYYVKQGLLQPSREQAEELERLSDPFFPTDRQYLACARGITGYGSFNARGCRLMDSLRSNRGTVAKGSTLLCTVGEEGLAIELETKETYLWPWKEIRRWKSYSMNDVMFEVCVQDGNATVLKWLSLETSQGRYLMASASSMCTHMQTSTGGGVGGGPKKMPPGRVIVGLAEFINKELFGKPGFASLEN